MKATSIGDRLKAARVNVGLGLRQAARAAPMSAGRLSELETGKATNVELNTLLHLCSVYSTTLSKLAEGIK